MNTDKEIIFKGYLREKTFGEGDALSIGDEFIVKLFEDNGLMNSPITVSYYITETECTLEEAQEDFVKKLYGISDGELTNAYSEITGYLWTDENLKIGGHDLVDELYSYSDFRDGSAKYCILKVIKHKDEEL